MHSRRSVLAAGATASVAATAGCLDFILGDDLSFGATAASVSQDALDATGYEERRIRKQTTEREFDAGGESRTVGITNWHAEYDRSIDLPAIDLGSQRAATFTVFTTPKVEVLGQTFNPIADMSTAEIVRTSQDRYQGFGSLQQQGETTTTVLGSETALTRFTGTAEIADSGQSVDVELQLTEAVGSGSDYAVVMAAYPERISDVERDNVSTLVDGIQHDG